ncbi:ATP-binding protein [Phytoactinopolyspora limicola]|uniref:ATP-binding protein n=1 Tax=Phytoactinopolyspora limicola TaxID=2715536 RepID=UPI00140E3D92|nr:helix-turn-helix domain-containing protein [Phytoactinopolyspora limicola]
MPKADPVLTAAIRPPTPVGVATLDDLSNRLRELREWSGSPSYAQIAQRIKALRERRGLHPHRQHLSRATVYDCFRLGRSRVDVDLVLEIVQALGVSPTDAVAWRQAHAAAMGTTSTAAVVEVLPSIPTPATTFTARGDELTEIVTQPLGSTMAIVGMPGIGKTELALRSSAELTRSHVYPDGTFFVDLRGHHPAHQPAQPSAVVAGLLTATGHSASKIGRLSPAHLFTVWQTWARDRRFLAVFDNAAGDDQLDPLIPTNHGGHIIVTSRRRLSRPAKLQQRELDPLTSDNAIELLAETAGRERILADLSLAKRLAELCGFLPLDLNVVAAHLNQHPAWTVDDQIRRLEASVRGASMRPALSTSYERLEPAQQRMFRLLALFPAPSFSPPAAAALADCDPETALDVLASLRAEHLVRIPEPGRFGFHDLVRTFAESLLHEEEPYSAQRAAVRRLLDHYLAYSLHAVRVRWRDEEPMEPAVWNGSAPTVDLADPAGWLDGEHQAATMVAALAVEYDHEDYVAELSGTLATYLYDDGKLPAAEILHSLATSSGDLPKQGEAHRYLARVYEKQGRFEKAIHHLERAESVAPNAVVGRTHLLIGNIYKGLGRLDDALRHYQLGEEEALAADNATRITAARNNQAIIHRLAGDLELAERIYTELVDDCQRRNDFGHLIMALSNRAVVYLTLGRYAEADDDVDRGLDLCESSRIRIGVPMLLNSRGQIRRELGRFAEAVEAHNSARSLAAEQGDVLVQGESQALLGRALVAAGQPADGMPHLESALELARDVSGAVLEVEVLNSMGTASLALGSIAQARTHHHDALSLATEARDLDEIARAQAGLGHCAHASGDNGAAAEHWRLALATYERLNARHAAVMREHLDAIPPPSPDPRP